MSIIRQAGKEILMDIEAVYKEFYVPTIRASDGDLIWAEKILPAKDQPMPDWYELDENVIRLHKVNVPEGTIYDVTADLANQWFQDTARDADGVIDVEDVPEFAREFITDDDVDELNRIIQEALDYDPKQEHGTYV